MDDSRLQYNSVKLFQNIPFVHQKLHAKNRYKKCPFSPENKKLSLVSDIDLFGMRSVLVVLLFC